MNFVCELVIMHGAIGLKLRTWEAYSAVTPNISFAMSIFINKNCIYTMHIHKNT